MTPADAPENPTAVGCGYLLLTAGFGLLGLLTLTGVGAAGRDAAEDMTPAGHVLGILVCGPFVLLWVVSGFYLVRRRRWR